MKNKNKKIRIKKSHIILTALLIGSSLIGFNGQIKPYSDDITTIEPVQAKNNNNELASQITDDPIKKYIITKALDNKLDPLQIISIIDCESNFYSSAYNINANNTIDIGLVQINSIHFTGKNPSTTLKCASDPYCSIDWMISKRLRDGNYSAWVCAKLNNIK